MGILFVIYALPLLSLAFVVWAVASRNLPDGPRRLTMVATILLACGVWTLVRTSGLTATGSEFAWRWSETPEERLLARAGDEPGAMRAAPVSPQREADWPGFRGPDRNGVINGVRIETDCRAMAPADRTGLVVLRGPRRPPLHPGAAR